MRRILKEVAPISEDKVLNEILNPLYKHRANLNRTLAASPNKMGRRLSTTSHQGTSRKGSGLEQWRESQTFQKMMETRELKVVPVPLKIAETKSNQGPVSPRKSESPNMGLGNGPLGMLK